MPFIRESAFCSRQILEKNQVNEQTIHTRDQMTTTNCFQDVFLLFVRRLDTYNYINVYTVQVECVHQCKL